MELHNRCLSIVGIFAILRERLLGDIRLNADNPETSLHSSLEDPDQLELPVDIYLKNPNIDLPINSPLENPNTDQPLW